MVEVPGVWRRHSAGDSVLCRELRYAKDGRPRGRCDTTILMTGLRACYIRVVGTREIRMSTSIEGWTHRCDCGTIYEIDWEDRRILPRAQPDRRVSA